MALLCAPVLGKSTAEFGDGLDCSWRLVCANLTSRPRSLSFWVLVSFDGSLMGVGLTMQVGTLDSLMQLSDDLVRIDMLVENMVRKIEKQYMEVAGEASETLKVRESLSALGAGGEGEVSNRAGGRGERDGNQGGISPNLDRRRGGVGQTEAETGYNAGIERSLTQGVTTLTAFQRRRVACMIPHPTHHTVAAHCGLPDAKACRHCAMSVYLIFLFDLYVCVWTLVDARGSSPPVALSLDFSRVFPTL